CLRGPTPGGTSSPGTFENLSICTERSRQRRRRVPSTLSSSTAMGDARFLFHVNYPTLRIGWVEQRLTKESLGCICIVFGREQKINGLPGSIAKFIFEPFSARPDVARHA